MTDAKEMLRARLRERIDAVSKSPHAVSRAIGANVGYVRDLLDPEKTSMPSIAKLRDLARELDTTAEYLLGEASTSQQPRSEVSFHEAPAAFGPAGGEGIPVVGTAWCDDLAVEGADGEPFTVERILLEVDHTIRLIYRPPAMFAARGAYAIQFQGTSMEPRYRQGDIGVVDPRRSPAPGDDVVVQLNDGNGGRDVITVLVKVLVRQAAQYIELRQFNPAITFRIPRGQVARLHRIVPIGELLGG